MALSDYKLAVEHLLFAYCICISSPRVSRIVPCRRNRVAAATVLASPAVRRSIKRSIYVPFPTRRCNPKVTDVKDI